MKRKAPAVPIYPHLWRCFPFFFWCTCEQCKEGFRREKGWRFLSGPWHGGAGAIRYLCESCGGHSAEEASIAIQQFMTGSRPRPPPSPNPPPERMVRRFG